MQRIEKELQKKLNKTPRKEEGEELYSYYVNAYSYLQNNVFSEIPKKVPELTSHDERHIINVLDNIGKLLGDAQIKSINAMDLYFLCLATIFHDAGLLYGRDNHQNNIAGIYDDIRGENRLSYFANEKSILLQIVAAHTGKSRNDNTYDTLKDLGKMNAYADSINVREIAAILRFADELAEGIHRTSEFLIAKKLYKRKSQIYHIYSQAYSSVVSFDRIAITYNLFIKKKDSVIFIDDNITLENFLEFIYIRLTKLDEERKYCRYYCQLWLSCLKEISIDFKFWTGGTEIKHNLTPIILDDKIVPRDSKSFIADKYPTYKCSAIITMLKKNMIKKRKE